MKKFIIPPSDTEIQTIATLMSVVVAAPTTAMPRTIPPIRIDRRTRVVSKPRAIKWSTSQPPTTRSVIVATPHAIAA
ncbi:MAG TPA: hypothetical protein VN603_00100 [Candidatus Acidoferrales bacterium]|nr:hypothetical protein [Candidatus Acidoferrales bacterium]